MKNISDEQILEMVINQFNELEKQLIECIEFIPFIDKNKDVVSPKFVPLILESCGLIDSIFKELMDERNRKSNFKTYAKLHEDSLDLGTTISIFLGEPIRFYQPYKNWDKEIPDWWKAYNKLKHDRLNNFEFAIYEYVISSVAALHQLICKCRMFTNSIIKNGWIDSGGEYYGELLFARISESGIPIGIIPCESNLFVTPLEQNFVVFRDDGVPIVEECDFSPRTFNLLTLSGIY